MRALSAIATKKKTVFIARIPGETKHHDISDNGEEAEPALQLLLLS